MNEKSDEFRKKYAVNVEKTANPQQSNNQSNWHNSSEHEALRTTRCQNTIKEVNNLRNKGTINPKSKYNIEK